ncbi:hypothetical protein ElyMa_004456800 [Elysia marginata]|uniref:Partner and localiser of BRCA2 WD40 domain-containing protein n=1 Tax=Elysia marginata TaxID=1093978 RepID=A0AAV4HGF3_9GAST|nr:hypothetical protein ElyMa_004456800 [Elysia marginata]
MDDETNKIKQKLLEMKREFAQKQKKLERARRAARVKAHVRKKIKEHEEMESSLKLPINGKSISADSQSKEEKKQPQQEKVEINIAPEQNHQAHLTADSRILCSKTVLQKRQTPLCETDNFLPSSYDHTQLVCHNTGEVYQDFSQTQTKNKIKKNVEDCKTGSASHISRGDALGTEEHSDRHTVLRLSTPTPSEPNRGNEPSKCDMPNIDSSKLFSDSKPSSILKAKGGIDWQCGFELDICNNSEHGEDINSSCFKSKKEDIGGKSCERLKEQSNLMQGKLKQESSFWSINEKIKKPIDDGQLSQLNSRNTKGDVQLLTNKKRDRHIGKRSSWIDTDFHTDQSDFKTFPQNHINAQEEIVGHYDQNGWLSTVKMKEATYKGNAKKRHHTKNSESVKSKISKKGRASLLKKEAFRSTEEPMQAIQTSENTFMSNKAVKPNISPRNTNQKATTALSSSPSFNTFQSSKKPQKPLISKQQDTAENFATVVLNQKDNINWAGKLTLVSDEIKEKLEKHSHSSNGLKEKPIVEISTQNYMPRISQIDKGLLNTLQLEVETPDSVTVSIDKGVGSNKPSLALQNTQESLLSLTPTFKTTLCSVRENHKISQKDLLVGPNEVTDSEFFNILGIQQSQEPVISDRSSPNAQMTDENSQSGPHIKHAGIHTTENSFNSRPVKEDQGNLSAKAKDYVTNGQATKESGNHLCSVFENILPPSQTLSEFSEYTELDSIPFSQFELSEDLLSSGNSLSKQRSSTKALVRRRSRRISSGKPFEFRLSDLSVSQTTNWDNASSLQSEVHKYTKGKRPSQAQQRKAAMVISIFQFLQDRAKEPNLNCDFDLTPDFDCLKKERVCHALCSNAETLKQNTSHSTMKIVGVKSHDPINRAIPYLLTGDFEDKYRVFNEENKFLNEVVNAYSQSQESICSPIVLGKATSPASQSSENLHAESKLSIVQAVNSENQIAETENVLGTETSNSQLRSMVEAGTVLQNNFSKSLSSSERNASFSRNHLTPTNSKSKSNFSNNPLMSYVIENQGNLRRQALSSFDSQKNLDAEEPQSDSCGKAENETHKTLDDKAATAPNRNLDSKDHEKQEQRDNEKQYVMDFDNPQRENNALVSCTDQISDNIKHIDKLLCNKTPTIKCLPSNEFNVHQKTSQMDPATEAEAECVNLQQNLSHSYEKDNRSQSKVSMADSKVINDSTQMIAGDVIPVVNIDDATDLKNKVTLNLACNNLISLNASCNNISPQVHKTGNVSSPFHKWKNNFESPSNILNSLLSPVTPVMDNGISKSIRSLSRKSISFTSTPIRKAGAKARSNLQNQIDIDFESPISKSRSASGSSFINADLVNSPDLNRSQDDLTSVYSKALSVLSSPQNIHVAETVVQKMADGNDSVYSERAPTLEVSTNLSLVPVCDESYPSPGQVPVSDNHSLNISASVCNDCTAEVSTAVETSTTKLILDESLNKSNTLLSSPYVVHPWKKLARTATTPVQILEAETSSFEHGSFSFTCNQQRGKTKSNNRSDIKSNMKFSGCFQSDSQDAVVSLLCGRLKSQSHPECDQAYIVSVQATSLTVWGEDDTLGWTTELDWRLNPESHILKACLMPGFSRVAVLVTGWLSSTPFASLLTYEWDTEETMRFNIPFRDLPRQLW